MRRAAALIRLVADAGSQPSTRITQPVELTALSWFRRDLHCTAGTCSPIHVEDEPYSRSRPDVRRPGHPVTPHPPFPPVPGKPTLGRTVCSPALQRAHAPLTIPPVWPRRQRQQIVLGNRVPTTAPDTWLAPDAIIIGDVDLFDRVRPTVRQRATKNSRESRCQ